MPATTTKSAYWRGVRDGAPFMLVVGPFGALFGVVATEAGMPVAQAMVMAVLVIAGAAQFAALQLMLEDAALWLVLAGALVVNLRMAMYSAALVPHLGAAPLWQRALAGYFNFDQTYAMSVALYEAEPGMTLRAKLGFYFGVATPIVPVWTLATFLGAVLGAQVPEALALDFARPILFLALIGPMIRTRAHLAAAIVSVIAALLLSGLPAGVGLLIAAVLAMGAGAAVETWQERRA